MHGFIHSWSQSSSKCLIYLQYLCRSSCLCPQIFLTVWILFIAIEVFFTGLRIFIFLNAFLRSFRKDSSLRSLFYYQLGRSCLLTVCFVFLLECFFINFQVQLNFRFRFSEDLWSYSFGIWGFSSREFAKVWAFSHNWLFQA